MTVSRSSEDEGTDDMTTSPGAILVMTVGSGDLTRIEETLFTPLRKSIATDAWTRIILLPSGMTEEFAEKLRNGLETVDAAIRALPAGWTVSGRKAAEGLRRPIGRALADVREGSAAEADAPQRQRADPWFRRPCSREFRVAS